MASVEPANHDAVAPSSRRTFLMTSAAAAGGLLVSAYFGRPADGQSRAQPAQVKYRPDAFVRIAPDGKVVIQVNRLEFGQGVATALPLLLAEELDADWSQVVAELAPAADVYKDPMYGIQMVGGSGTIAHSFEQYRELGARVRAMLVTAAAARWKVSPDQCRTQAGVVFGPANQSAKYGELAQAASSAQAPSNVRLKDPREFRLVGKATRRLDSRPKCDGSLKFGLDLDLPGMKVAVVAHPPTFGGRVKSVDDSGARATQGVSQIVQIPLARGGTGVAVIADTFWPAKQARDRLKIDWDLSNVERADSTQLLAKYRELVRTPGSAAVSRGDANAIDRASDRLVADFEFPYLAHTPMEPLNATVRFDGNRAEAWIGSQFQTVDQQAIAEVLGVPPDRVTFHTEMAGGGFGRRAVADSHIPREAAEIAKRVPGTPVKMIWTREDDVRGGYYRPMHVHHVEVAVDADGLPAAWRHVIVGQSILTGTPFAPMLVKQGVDETAIEGAFDTHYAIANFHLSAHHPTVNVPVLWWRSVGHTHNAFVMETLVDELATRAGADPFAYRRRLLKPDARKLHDTLDLLETNSASWRQTLARDHAIGVALHESFGTGVGCVVDVSIENGRPRLHRATAAVHVGLPVNPLTIESQVQGGLVFGISQLMANGAITLRDGVVLQSNFHDFTPPYMRDAPLAIDVHIVPSADPPSGVGEPGVPVMAPAVANALSKLTGKRYRTLPLTTIV
jgi:isoquinoline 1-oxidoreductase beta subunit